MQVIYTKNDLEALIGSLRSQGKTIGFVPTMGALHPGHISLIDQSKKSSDITVCSIFVNPTQFNDKNDLVRYPRTPEKDARMLEQAGCDILFMPAEQEIYPGKDERQFDFGYLDKILDGAARPGHFNGVAQVVSLLFGMVKPDKAFFGQKDYQQVMIVKALVKQFNLGVEIVPCPILREPDGLAMSSRNALLSREERAEAGFIPGIMQEARKVYHERGLEAAKAFVQEAVKPHPLMRLDYYSICDKDTLMALDQVSSNAIALIAVFVGKIRLIDNLML